jgi:hypothetical protein
MARSSNKQSSNLDNVYEKTIYSVVYALAWYEEQVVPAVVAYQAVLDFRKDKVDQHKMSARVRKPILEMLKSFRGY